MGAGAGGGSQNRAYYRNLNGHSCGKSQGGGVKFWKQGSGGSAVTKQSIREGRHVRPLKGLHGEAGEKPLCSWDPVRLQTNPGNLVVSLSLQVGLRAKSQKEMLDAEESKEPIRPVLPSILHLTANKTLESNGSPDPCLFLFGPTLTRKQAGKGMLGSVVLSLTKATKHNPPGSLN